MPCAFLFFLLVAQPTKATETLSSLISEARLYALDSSSVRQRFTDSQITSFLNQAQREESVQTRCLRRSFSFQLVPGTTYYALPSDYLTMERVTIGYKYIPEASPAALDGRSRGWEQASGYPTYYFVNFSSRGLLGFAPWPATSTDTDTVKIEFDVQPSDMSTGTDQPFNGAVEMQDYAHSLGYFAAAVMSQIQGLTAKASGYMGLYSSVMAGMSKQCLSRPVYLPSAVGTP